MKQNPTEYLGVSSAGEKQKQSCLVEVLTLIAYACALIFIMYYHEPWFDEGQSWLIARDASIADILSNITHYEGHPPFWFLILLPLAKMGVPFELGIKAVNFIFTATAMGLFIFKAPFKRLIRCLIPFTYFFFYQYGVISRPYSLMMLGFILSAWFYKDRNEKPFRFIAALAIICGASSYGIVLSAGICLVWLWGILNKKISLQNIKSFLKSREFYALLLLFSFNLLLLFWIYPYPDTYGISIRQGNSFMQRLFYMLFIAPADATCSLSNLATSINIKIDSQTIGRFIMGFLVNIILLVVTRMYKKQLLFIIPYFLLAVFGAAIYFSSHHVGIIAMFYLFILWCCFADKPEVIELPKGIQKLIQAERDRNYLNYFSRALVVVVIGISLYWSIAASVNDIKYNYGTGREAAAFITENRFDQLKMMTAWLVNIDPETQIKTYDFNFFNGIPTLAYFDRNIFLNFNNGLNKCYLTHKVDSAGSWEKMIIEKGYPDVLYGDVDLEFIFGTQLSKKDYELVKSVKGNMIWKDSRIENRQFIYLRKDLLENYPNLKILNPWYEMLPE